MHTPEAWDDRRAACQTALLQRLDADLAGVQAAVHAAAAGTRLDGDRPENRGERGALSSQGALAGALAERLAQLHTDRLAVAALHPGPRRRPCMGAFVVAEDDKGNVGIWWLAPGAGGDQVGADVIAVSPNAPIGRAWLGAEVGDTVVVGPRTWTVVAFH